LYLLLNNKFYHGKLINYQ